MESIAGLLKTRVNNLKVVNITGRKMERNRMGKRIDAWGVCGTLLRMNSEYRGLGREQ